MEVVVVFICFLIFRISASPNATQGCGEDERNPCGISRTTKAVHQFFYQPKKSIYTNQTDSTLFRDYLPYEKFVCLKKLKLAYFGAPKLFDFYLNSCSCFPERIGPNALSDKILWQFCREAQFW